MATLTSNYSSISPVQTSKRHPLLGSSDKKSGIKSSELAEAFASQRSSTRLSIPDMFFGDEGALQIAKFLQEEDHKFSVIELRGNNISSAGLSALCDAIKVVRCIKKISLEWNNIGSDTVGLLSLLDLLQSNSNGILSIDLRNNRIGPQCAGILASIIRDAQSLKTIDLRWNELGDEGAKHIFPAIQENPNKVHVDFAGNKISQEMLLEFDLATATTASSARMDTSMSAYSSVPKKGDQSYRPSAISHIDASNHTPEHSFLYNKENFPTENYPQPTFNQLNNFSKDYSSNYSQRPTQNHQQNSNYHSQVNVSYNYPKADRSPLGENNGHRPSNSVCLNSERSRNVLEAITPTRMRVEKTALII